jgi:hypothetical protein
MWQQLPGERPQKEVNLRTEGQLMTFSFLFSLREFCFGRRDSAAEAIPFLQNKTQPLKRTKSKFSTHRQPPFCFSHLPA